MAAAALAQIGGLQAPASSLCSGSGCHVEARTAALHAQCQGRETSNIDRLGMLSYPNTAESEFRSDINAAMCVTLSRNNPATFVISTSGYPAGCETNRSSGCDGEWATIFGARVNAVDASSNSTLPINLVDCAIQSGNTTVRQPGGGSPMLDRDSFETSTQTSLELGAAHNAWRGIYTSEAEQITVFFHVRCRPVTVARVRCIRITNWLCCS